MIRPMPKVKVGLVQMKAESTPEKNLKRALSGLEEAARRGARIACLQELFRTPYFCRTEDHRKFRLAEPIPGPTTRALSGVAARLGIVIIGSLFERRAEGIYHNTAVVLDADGTLAGTYRKMHIPDDPGFYEKFYFAPGDLGFRAFTTKFGRIAVLVCWDQWFPEGARLAALAGAQILFYPTAIGRVPADSLEVAAGQRDAWQTIQRAHAIANGVFVAAVNRVGREGNLDFWGHSFVCDPSGKVLAQAGNRKEEVLVADCDMALIEETRQMWPFLRDRRVDAYRGLLSRHLNG